MESRLLGRSGLFVSAISFGAMTFGGEGRFQVVGQTGETEAERLIDICLDSGVTLFDTADAYSNGRSEEILAHALGAKRHRAIIATKAWGRMGPGPNDIGASRQHLVQACEASLKRLKTDYIDVYQIHGFDVFTPLEETLRAFDDLVRSGKVRYIGCSNYTGWQLMKALAISDSRNAERYVSQQIYYSLAGRDAENELVPLGLDQGVGVLVWSPLAFGMLSGKFRRGQPNPEGARGTLAGAPGGVDRALVDKITDVQAEIAQARGVTMAQVAVNWLLKKPGISSVIVGARDEAQLKDNLAAAAWSLTDDEMKRLDEVSETPRPYPYGLQKSVFGDRNP